jgi:hypothetical protein
MSNTSPEEIMQEFKQYLKQIRLDEIEKNKSEKEAMVLKQIKMLVDDSND